MVCKENAPKVSTQHRMWLACQISIDCRLPIRNRGSPKKAQKRAGETRTFFLSFHCSSCRWKSCVDAFEGIFSPVDVSLRHNILREDSGQQEEEEMAASQVNVLYGSGAVLLFLLKCLDWEPASLSFSDSKFSPWVVCCYLLLSFFYFFLSIVKSSPLD